jgi:hypothetical protein
MTKSWGVKSYPSVTNLPEAPDVVAIVVPWDQVLDALQESHRKGAGSAIVISAGFAERGVENRRDLQREMGAFASTSGMTSYYPAQDGRANIGRSRAARDRLSGDHSYALDEHSVIAASDAARSHVRGLRFPVRRHWTHQAHGDSVRVFDDRVARAPKCIVRLL